MNSNVADRAAVGWGDKLKLRVSAVVWFLLLAGFLLALPVLADISIWVPVLLAVVALLLAFPAAWIVRMTFRGQRAQSWWTSLTKAWAALLFLLGIVGAAPLYAAAFFTALHPVVMPQAVLSNGSRTIIFQGMSHIGSEGFYKSVVYDLEKALSDGSVVYYEGVMPSPDGDAWFSRTLADGGDLSANYKLLSDVCGLKFQQDYFMLLLPDMQAHPERHVSADVTTADMMHEYERLMQNDADFALCR
jgi:hypothetical protein